MRRIARHTADVAINEVIELGGAGQIEEFRIHLNGASATAEDLTLTLQSATAGVYNVVLLAQDMNTIQDLTWQPVRPIITFPGDRVQVQWDNTNGRVYGMELIWSGRA